MVNGKPLPLHICLLGPIDRRKLLSVVKSKERKIVLVTKTGFDQDQEGKSRPGGSGQLWWHWGCGHKRFGPEKRWWGGGQGKYSPQVITIPRRDTWVSIAISIFFECVSFTALYKTSMQWNEWEIKVIKLNILCLGANTFVVLYLFGGFLWPLSDICNISFDKQICLLWTEKQPQHTVRE